MQSAVLLCWPDCFPLPNGSSTDRRDDQPVRHVEEADGVVGIRVVAAAAKFVVVQPGAVAM